jgi:two-component system CheB/CheR fusion protein
MSAFKTEHFEILLKSKSEKKGALHKHNILLVDDDQSTLDAIRTFLLNEGANLVLANSGEEAIEAFLPHRKHIQTILLDINLPKMSGFDAYEIMRKLNTDFKVIFMSASDQDKKIKDLRRFGKMDFLLKPFNAEQLVKTITRIVQQG